MAQRERGHADVRRHVATELRGDGRRADEMRRETLAVQAAQEREDVLLGAATNMALEK
jgi:hypothetical protein